MNGPTSAQEPNVFAIDAEDGSALRIDRDDPSVVERLRARRAEYEKEIEQTSPTLNDHRAEYGILIIDKLLQEGLVLLLALYRSRTERPVAMPWSFAVAEVRRVDGVVFVEATFNALPSLGPEAEEV